MYFALATLVAALAQTASAQVQGKAFGFAAGTTGGGNAAPQYPSSIAELKSWLTDNTARTIMIDRSWDFRGTEGTTSRKCCSDNRTTKCPGGTSQGQAYIQDTCDGGTWIDCTFDNAGRAPIEVGPNKSIVGVGNKGALIGKGLRVRGGKSNIIIQNIHITNLNPQFVWGGDALTIDDGERVWIDHCKTSLIGRQHLVSGWGKASKVTISNHEFDGKSTWSAGCNGKHYWTVLLVGAKDTYTFAGNWLHDVSGRAPHMGTTTTANSENIFHGVNNYFSDVGGHAFDIDANTWVLLEGNYFERVTTPLTSDSSSRGGNVFVVNTVDDASACVTPLGKICEWNRASGSGTVTALRSTAALNKLSSVKGSIIKHIPVADVPAKVRANAGVGRTTSTNA